MLQSEGNSLASVVSPNCPTLGTLTASKEELVKSLAENAAFM